MLFILRNAYKTLSVEIDQYFQQIGNNATRPSKQAISKARMKIRHSGFIKINDTIVETYYEEPYKTYKGFRLLAADGSILQLPTDEEIEKAFGKMNKQSDWFNCGYSMMIYDVLNKIIVDAKLNKYGRSERRYLQEQLEEMQRVGKQKKDIIIADRGLPSLPLLVRMKQLGYDYVIRYNGENFLREFKEFARCEQTDSIIEISLKAHGTRQHSGELKELLLAGSEEKLKVRVVKIVLKTGESEYLVTSLLDKEFFSAEDIGEIYGKRWGIEEEFKTLKNTMEIENFSGKSEETVLQEYYSKIAICNLHSNLVEEAQKQLDEKVRKDPKIKKYERYQINQNVSYGLVRNRITELFGEENGDWEQTYDYLLEAVQRNPNPVKPDRHFDRRQKCKLRFPISRRRAV